MSKTALPKSKAKTAYELLTEIKELALEEPKRIAMGTWLEQENVGGSKSPACGTVGCIAGWACVLTKKVVGYLDTPMAARDVLGISTEQSQKLFIPHRLCESTRQQTPAHARAVARHIEKFQKKYEKQLKAKKL